MIKTEKNNKSESNNKTTNKILILGIDYRVTRTTMNNCGKLTVSECGTENRRICQRESEELS